MKILDRLTEDPRGQMPNSHTKIFGIGLSRTGTMSLTKALTTLEIKTRHYPNDKTTQNELKAGNYDLSVLREVQALTDIPVSPYYAQLDRRFPQSKFILTTRPTDSWLQSMENHFRLYVERRRDDFDDFVLACVYGSLHFSAERFAYVKELHEDNCRSYFAERPGQLLVLDLHQAEDSWVNICNFLDRPVPSEPFPHENRKRLHPARPLHRENLLRRFLRRIQS